MIWVSVLASLLLVLLLISLIRIAGEVEYCDLGLHVTVRAFGIHYQVFPAKEKKPKKAKSTEAGAEGKAEEPPKKKKPAGGGLGPLQNYLPLVAEAAGALRRKIRIDRLMLDFTSGGADPSSAAMLFGYSNIAIGMIWPLLEQNFLIKSHSLCTRVDFDAASPAVYMFASFSMRVGQLVSFGLRIGSKFLKIYLAARQENKLKLKKEAIENE